MITRRRTILIALGAIAAAVLAGCAQKARLKTVDEFVAALARAGVTYEARTPVDLSKMRRARVSEAVKLTGPGLDVEVWRVDDQRTFKAMIGSGMLLAAAEAKSGQALPGKPDLYAKHPFAVVIRRQPEGAPVTKALERIMPGGSL